MSQPKQLTEQEFYEAVHAIAKPTFNFMLRRINKSILNNEKHKSLDMNHFFNVLISSMASVDTNMMRWMQGFNKIKTNTQMDEHKLLLTFISCLDKSLKTVVQ